MNVYNLWCDLADGVSDVAFAEAIATFLDRLVTDGQLTRWRLLRRKLGLGPDHVGEFHIMLEFETLAALDETFNEVSSRADPVESLHHAVNSKVKNARFALYRDFPDAHRVRGSERF